MYRRPIVPESFEVPLRLDGPGFYLRPLTVNDLIKDYDAVMVSADHLYHLMSPDDEWPRGLTIEEDLIDLGWHQREFTLRHSFAYTVMAPDDKSCLGCCYIYPSASRHFEVDAFYWARSDSSDRDLEPRLGRAFRDWLSSRWLFAAVAFPGRDIPWDKWRAEIAGRA